MAVTAAAIAAVAKTGAGRLRATSSAAPGRWRRVSASTTKVEPIVTTRFAQATANKPCCAAARLAASRMAMMTRL